MNAQLTAHTPGPWSLSETGDAITAHDGGTLIVETSKHRWENLDAATHGGNEVARRNIPAALANARLIAAAPELLALVRGWRFTDPHGLYSDACRAAIAKATGQQD